jgi:hypothetical protein
VFCRAEPVYPEHAEGKGSIAVRIFLLFRTLILIFVVPPFALMQKVEPKMEASLNRSARLAAHAQQQSLQHSSLFYVVPRCMFPF